MRTPAARRLARVLWDLTSWLLATVAVVGSRYDFQLNQVLWGSVILYAVIACLVQATIGTIGMLYRGRYRIATFEECVGLAMTTALAGTTLALGFLSLSPPGTFPRAVAILTPPVALLSMAAGRLAFRALRERAVPHPDAEKIIIYGAGNAGSQLIRLLVRTTPARARYVGRFHRRRPEQAASSGYRRPGPGPGADLVDVADGPARDGHPRDHPGEPKMVPRDLAT